MISNKKILNVAVVVAAIQLLSACSQKNSPSFISHFKNDDFLITNNYLGEDKPIEISNSQFENESSENNPVRIVEGTGKVLAESKVLKEIKAQPVKLNFEEAPLGQVVRTVLGDMLKLDYVLHPPISGTITLSTSKNLSTDDVLNLLETALQANGMALVRDTRGTFHVGRIDALRNLGATIRQVNPGATMAPGYGTIIVPLEFIAAAEMAAILKPMMPAEALIRVDSARNLLVMVGSRTQAEGWLEMVRTFDVNLLAGMSVGIFPLKYLTISEVSSGLAMLSGGELSSNAVLPVGKGTGANTAPVGNSSSAFGGSIRVIPIERLNSVLVITKNKDYLEEARRWINKLDQPGSAGSQAQLNIYRVQNGNAKHLAAVLSGIFGSKDGIKNSVDSGIAPGLTPIQTSSAGLSQGLGFDSVSGNQKNNTTNKKVLDSSPNVSDIGGIRVMADELNNSVLVWGTTAEYERIEIALRKLDLPPTQVLIEASIVEVTLNEGLEYGLEWAFSGNAGGGKYTDSGALKKSSSSSSLTEALGQGFSYTLRNSVGNIRAVMTALSSKTNVKVVASPTMMVLDNHEASITVGTQQPYLSGTTINAVGGSATSYQYKDTGVSLQVTPSVNAGNIVTMSINQAVTDIGEKDPVTEQRSFLQRQLSSRVAVRSGESLVMGGLIQENTNNGRSGLPLLHDLPVVGNLFGSTNESTRRTELVVIITPRVVRSDIDVRNVTDDLRAHMGMLKPILLPKKSDKDAMLEN